MQSYKHEKSFGTIIATGEFMHKDRLTISTYGIKYIPERTRTTELLSQGYEMFIRDGIKVLIKDDDVIEIKEDNDGY